MPRRFRLSVDQVPSWDESLTLGALSLGLPLDREAVRRFHQYALLLQKWGEKVNLTSRLEPGDIISRHFLDSLALLVVDPPGMGERLLDYGTGAGFPGLPLKIVRPDLQVVLVESSRKKAEFCSTVIHRLGLRGIAVDQRRGEELAAAGLYSRAFHWVVSRAAAPLDSLLGSAEGLVKEGGGLAAYKGPGEGRPFLAAGAETPAGWHCRGEFHVKVPGRETPRALVIFRKD